MLTSSEANLGLHFPVVSYVSCFLCDPQMLEQIHVVVIPIRIIFLQILGRICFVMPKH